MESVASYSTISSNSNSSSYTLSCRIDPVESAGMESRKALSGIGFARGTVSFAVESDSAACRRWCNPTAPAIGRSAATKVAQSNPTRITGNNHESLEQRSDTLIRIHSYSQVSKGKKEVVIHDEVVQAAPGPTY